MSIIYKEVVLMMQMAQNLNIFKVYRLDRILKSGVYCAIQCTKIIHKDWKIVVITGM